VGKLDRALDAYGEFRRWQSAPPAAPAGQPPSNAAFLFPVPLSEIQAIGPAFVVDTALGVMASPNHFGGHIFYDWEGEPVGFSAYHIPSGTTLFFDRWGRLL
jgi:hypothetical protein